MLHFTCCIGTFRNVHAHHRCILNAAIDLNQTPRAIIHFKHLVFKSTFPFSTALPFDFIMYQRGGSRFPTMCELFLTYAIMRNSTY